ncbi:exo-alpha-sialidase [Tautonia plasticadhaerens]|uniref:BNR/Asp-box repeat protein n=1 Tax=Tautonia plasticadhaerens TaxID=2527974 RepID=A0A518H115_9BACT|nr:LamG-like jellyroll fold domain-containing protein [Tautonia plasticadhaerens]QDV34534.1 BNR/Asp-box repeat protein [Tautonia plasticadhaerens]
MPRRPRLPLIPALLALLIAPSLASAADDPRDIRNGWTIPDEGYCDQPYVVVTDQGHWLCTMTTGTGHEGQAGQHIVATISADRGRTWSDHIPIEPSDGPEASWVMPLKVPGGRIYAFYTYNSKNIREVPSNSDPVGRRVDTLGAYAFKYSDDGGRTWSDDRFEIPMRRMGIDRGNTTGGEVLFFWGVGKPISVGDDAYLGFAKVGKWGTPGAMVESQGVFMHSDNILAEPDPSAIRWELLPEGDEGLRAPKGPVSDEANLVSLSDGSLFATYRTIDGYPCQAYSRDGGRTWTPTAYMTYGPDGRRVKHPRAANFVRKFDNGKYLYWFHFHGGEPVHREGWNYYEGRNPAWVLGGVERDGLIHWSEPEILLYDEDPDVRISYPDFVEDGGRYYVTETQKETARVHEIDPGLLDDLWGQLDRREVEHDGLALEHVGDPIEPGSEVEMPSLPDLQDRGGFAIELQARFRELTGGQTLLDTRDESGRGIRLVTTTRSTLGISLGDGTTEATWDSDPGTGPGTLRVGDWQHITVIVDAGPRILSVVVDGVLNDGGALRQHGWTRFLTELGDVNGRDRARLASRLYGDLRSVRIYDRPLRTSEAVGNHRAGLLDDRGAIPSTPTGLRP